MLEILLVILGIIVIIVGLVAIPWLTRILVTALADQDILFSYRPEGRVKYLMNGANLVRMIYSIPGKRILQKDSLTINGSKINPDTQRPWRIGDVVPLTDNKEDVQANIIESLLGVYWIGISPRRILTYTFDWWRQERPEDKAMTEKEPGGYEVVSKKYHIVHRVAKTQYHEYQFIYPILAENVETSEQPQVTIKGTITVETRNAYIPVMNLNGKWFEQVKSAAIGAINDYVNQKTLEEIRIEKKGKNNSPLEEAVLLVNEGDEGLIATTGMAIVSFNFEALEVTKTEVEEAAEKEKLAKLTAKAVKATADGEAYRITKTGVAEGRAVRAILSQVGDNPHKAAVLQARSLKDLRGALALGGVMPTFPLTPPGPIPLAGDGPDEGDTSDAGDEADKAQERNDDSGQTEQQPPPEKRQPKTHQGRARNMRRKNPN